MYNSIWLLPIILAVIAIFTPSNKPPPLVPTVIALSLHGLPMLSCFTAFTVNGIQFGMELHDSSTPLHTLLCVDIIIM